MKEQNNYKKELNEEFVFTKTFKDFRTYAYDNVTVWTELKFLNKKFKLVYINKNNGYRLSYITLESKEEIDAVIEQLNDIKQKIEEYEDKERDITTE